MNTAMWEHPITAQQVDQLKAFGYIEIPCVAKKLVCGDQGGHLTRLTALATEGVHKGGQHHCPYWHTGMWSELCWVESRGLGCAIQELEGILGDD